MLVDDFVVRDNGEDRWLRQLLPASNGGYRPTDMIKGEAVYRYRSWDSRSLTRVTREREREDARRARCGTDRLGANLWERSWHRPVLGILQPKRRWEHCPEIVAQE